MTALLELDKVHKRFGGLQAVHDLSFTICSGEILGLIGPNGAGKTTVFNLINGVYAPDAGRIAFNVRILRVKRSTASPVAALHVRTRSYVRLRI